MGEVGERGMLIWVLRRFVAREEEGEAESVGVGVRGGGSGKERMLRTVKVKLSGERVVLGLREMKDDGGREGERSTRYQPTTGR